MSWPKAWALAAGGAAVLAVEWTRGAHGVPAAGLAVAVVLAAVALWRSGGSGRRRLAAATATLAALSAALVATPSSLRLARIRGDWPAVREEMVTAASRRLGAELDQAVERARSLAGRAATLLDRPPQEAFPALERLVSRRGPSEGVVQFDAGGRIRAWGGVQHVAIGPDGPELSAITTPFYVWLLARRQTDSGTTAAAVLLARAEEVPRAGTALADRFADATGVRLRFVDASEAPRSRDVFDWVLPGAAADTLFAVRPLPPEQGAAYVRALGEAQRPVLAAVLVLLVALAAAASRARMGLAPIFGVGLVALLCLGRAPLRQAFGAGSPFWPDTYYLRLLGPFSDSAGRLLLGGVVLFAAALALWRRGLAPTRARVAIAVLVTVVAPYVMRALARGITPPAGGTSPAQWLTWQVALVLPASVVVLLAAALVRGSAEPPRAGPGPWVACGMAVACAAAGLWLWKPGEAWPEWYPYLWIPALLLAIRPMRLAAALTTVAVVAGSSAALLVWGASNDGRMALATRDLDGLGDRTDAVAVGLLDRLVHETVLDAPPASPGELFLLWRRSALGAQGYPAALAVWSQQGERRLGLALAELDLPAGVQAAVASEARADGLPLVRPLLRVPGLHGIAAIPLAGGEVLTVAVGPRSQLVAPSRLASFLLGVRSGPEAPYEVALVPAEGAPPVTSVGWGRDGWVLRGERVVTLPPGARHVHAIVDLRGPSPLLQRGLLVLAFDALVLALLWLGVESAAGRTVPALRAWWPRAHRSLRLRLAVSLALFFVAPTVAFAGWSLGRLEEEFRGTHSLLLQRTLRDAAAGFAEQDPASDSAQLIAASRQVGAELNLFEGGELEATSAPVLADLGLADRLLESSVFASLAFGDQVEVARLQRATPDPALVGYRLIARAPDGAPVIMSAAELLSERAVRRREADLGIAVLVGGVFGVMAAVVLAGVAARALARPLDALRRAALDVATGARPAVAGGAVPVELEPIRDAMDQAAADVEAGQRAQRVLAWGEMARQVAHEIKNPLTPIRLGVQHLLRVNAERPAEIAEVLPGTGERILGEIDRLDGIARTFSRFALPEAERAPLEAVDLAAVAGDVVRLYRMGESGPAYRSEVGQGTRAMARPDELVEVLVNLCENARNAGAARVTIAARAADDLVALEVRDDGRGIAQEVLPRVFEPRFSTTTSGSGLGLAIARRLVESWGGRIEVAATGPAGTVVRLDLPAG